MACECTRRGSTKTDTGHLTLLLSPAAAAYYLPRHLAPSPTYPHLYPPYLIRGYPDTAALENRQTIINDYITSQQMHHNAASAMAQRADMLRGLSPRESSLALNYAAGPRGKWPRTALHSLVLCLPVLWCTKDTSVPMYPAPRKVSRTGHVGATECTWWAGWTWGEEGRCLSHQFTSSDSVSSRHLLLSCTWAFTCSEPVVCGIFRHLRDWTCGIAHLYSKNSEG